MIPVAKANPAKPLVPALYLAGKIGKNDWRHPLIPGLRERTWSDGPIVKPTYQYVGPFFVACSHGCAHGPNSHGVIGGEGCFESSMTQRWVISNNKSAIEKADLIFAYINATDCHGTLFEIGYASALGKRIIVAFAPEIDAADFWFSSMQCKRVYNSVARGRLALVLREEINKTKLAPPLPAQEKACHD